MWKPWTEAHAARTRARDESKLQASEEIGRPIRDGRDSRNRRKEWQEASEERKKSQLKGFVERHLKIKETMRQRRESQEVVEVVRHEPIRRNKKGEYGRLPGSKNHEFDYPPCPRCDSNIVKRAGFDRGVQRYICHTCGRSFGSNTVVAVRSIPFHVTCYRCGGEGDFLSFVVHKDGKRRTTQSGVSAHCNFCGKNFLQGGSEHLERTMSVLLERVDKEFAGKNSADALLVKQEVIQLASLDVIAGLGYTWNVPLRISEAKKILYSDSFETNDYRRKVKGESAYGTEA